MRKIEMSALMGLTLLMAAACDEGRIYPGEQTAGEAGAEVRLEAVVTGAETWPSGYTLSLAGFGADGEYALITKNISVSSNSEPAETVLTNIPSETQRVEVCVLDRLRRKVASFGGIDFDPEEESARIRFETLDISMEGAIQNEIFSTTCANCHGGSGHAAAGLNLTAGHSFPQLVGIESAKEPGKLRVSPGDAEASLLYQILVSEESAAWNYDHSKEIYSQVKLNLIRNWIDNHELH